MALREWLLALGQEKRAVLVALFEGARGQQDAGLVLADWLQEQQCPLDNAGFRVQLHLRPWADGWRQLGQALALLEAQRLSQKMFGHHWSHTF